jgi:hypothetical protein
VLNSRSEHLSTETGLARETAWNAFVLEKPPKTSAYARQRSKFLHPQTMRVLGQRSFVEYRLHRTSFLVR